MAETMSLATLLEHLDNISEDYTIYVADTIKAPSAATAAVALHESADGSVPSDMRYLLEVPLAREVIKVWSDWREGRIPSLDDKVEAVNYYSEHDAYLPTE
jgi:hypothetical protein